MRILARLLLYVIHAAVERFRQLGVKPKRWLHNFAVERTRFARRSPRRWAQEDKRNG